jgi:hypothetical protein
VLCITGDAELDKLILLLGIPITHFPRDPAKSSISCFEQASGVKIQSAHLKRLKKLGINILIKQPQKVSQTKFITQVLSHLTPKPTFQCKSEELK